MCNGVKDNDNAVYDGYYQLNNDIIHVTRNPPPNFNFGDFQLQLIDKYQLIDYDGALSMSFFLR